MKPLIIGLLLLFGANSLIAEMPSLPFVARIKGQRYCIANGGVVLMIKYEMDINNSGETGVVLYPPVLPTILVSRTREDLKGGRYEFELNPPDRFILSPEGQSAEQERFSKRLIVAPGEVHQSEVELGLPIATMKEGPVGDMLTPGRHYLKLEMVFDTVDAGMVHFVSQPITFVAAKRPKTVSCPSHGGGGHVRSFHPCGYHSTDAGARLRPIQPARYRGVAAKVPLRP